MYTSNTGLIRNYIKPIIGKLKLNEVTSRSLEQYLNLLEHNNEDTGGLPDTEAAAARLNPLEGLRETGGLPFFSRRAHLLTTPKGQQWSLPLASRALCEGNCGCCDSLQTMPQHLRALLSSSARLGKYRRFNRRYFSNRLRKPATSSFAAEMDGPPARPFSLCKRETEKERTR